MEEICKINKEFGRQLLKQGPPVMVQGAKSQILNHHTFLQGKPCPDERTAVLVTSRLQVLVAQMVWVPRRHGCGHSIVIDPC